jgi:hypothetical protein
MDDEEETVLMLWNFLQLLDTKINREVWVHPINQKRNLTGFIAELRLDPAKFYNYCRMTMSTFDYILCEIQGKILKQNTKWREAITPEERLLITLR